MWFLLIFCFICLEMSHAAYYPITRNPNSLVDWADAEIDFVSRLKASECHIMALDVVKSYLQDFDDACQNLKNYNVTEPVSRRAVAVTSNPIAVYRMIRRLTYQLPIIRKEVKPLKEDLFDRLQDQFRVTSKDVQDTITALLRIQHVYNYPASSIAGGNFGSISTGTNLKAIHCYEIGLEALRLYYFTLAVDWLETALTKSKVDLTIDEGLALSLLDSVIDKHDEIFPNRDQYSPYYFNEMLTPMLNNENYTTARWKQRDVLEYHFSTSNNTEPIYLNIKFAALCSGKVLQTEEEKSNLFCWYESKRHLYWLIGPLKMEFLAKDPDIVQIYEVIGEKQTKDLKDTVQKDLRLSSVVDSTPGAPLGAQMISKIRTSVNGWIAEYSHPTLTAVSRTMELVTGLKVIGPTASDALQVATYTFGGHYEAHLDALITKGFGEEAAGERVATFLYYLEEPELGGQTAFTEGKVAALPIKGSAVFWYDVHKDGEADFRTYHGACPVVLGRKWVANKWIRYFDQFIVRKCGLEPKERYRVPVNNNFIV